MGHSQKVTTKAHVKIEQGYVTISLYLPVKWLVLLLVSILIYFLPEFWQTIQTAISVVP